MIIKSLTAFAVSTALLAGAAVEADGGRKLQTSLTGASEVPSAGDPDGTGTAEITVNPGKSQVCYKLSVADIAPAAMAHIHEGGPTVAGPVKVTLGAPTSGMSSMPDWS